MTSGPGPTGKTDVPPEDAIEEISGLLEMDELKAGESQPDSLEVQAAAAHVTGEIMGEALDVSLETPGPLNLDSYLPPPPAANDAASGDASDVESGSASNMAYEDLLEKLVLPAKPVPSEEPEEASETPPFVPTRAGSSDSVSSPLANLFPPSPVASEERTVVTVNPLLAEEQEAAAREAENLILPAAPAAPPSFADTPVVAASLRDPIPPLALAPSKVIQMSYPMFGIMMLAAVLVGGVLSRLMAPTRVVVTTAPAQTPALVGRPVPVQVTQPVAPAPSAPQVVPLPTPTEARAQAAAKPAVAAEREQPVAAVQPTETVPAFDEPLQGTSKPRVHHVAKAAPRPPKSVAPKPAPSKPAAPKRSGKAWVDPFAQ